MTVLIVVALLAGTIGACIGFTFYAILAVSAAADRDQEAKPHD